MYKRRAELSLHPETHKRLMKEYREKNTTIDKSLLKMANDSGRCLSLLYDLGLLPEQIKTKEQQRKASCVILAVNAYEGRIKVLEKELSKIKEELSK